MNYELWILKLWSSVYISRIVSNIKTNTYLN